MKIIEVENYEVIDVRPFYEKTLQPTSLATKSQKRNWKNHGILQSTSLAFHDLTSHALIKSKKEEKEKVSKSAWLLSKIKKLSIYGITGFIIIQVSIFALASVLYLKHFGLDAFLGVVLH